MRMICALQHCQNTSQYRKSVSGNDVNDEESTVCASFVYAVLDKKTGKYVIKRYCDHTCSEDVSTTQGSRNGLYGNKFLARAAGSSVLENPSITPIHAASISAEHLNMSKDSIKYMYAYRIKEHLGKLRRGLLY